MRRAMAQRMAVAHAEVSPASVTDEADVDDWPKREDITVRLVRAIAVACKAEPSPVWLRILSRDRTIDQGRTAR
jgi:2-oxoisovalerate dehydrogenase E2 component (dihydrolipoyl transacylase)